MPDQSPNPDERSLAQPHVQADHLLPPPAIPEAEPDLAMRMLYDEQTRMRAELDALRKKGDEQGGKQEGKGGGEEGGEKGGSGGGVEKGGEEKQEDKKLQPPLGYRIRKWVRAHPRETFWGIVGTVLLIVLLIVLLWYLGSYQNTDDAFVDGHTDPISSRISGTVVSVYVENTYRVKKGQLLVQLDPRDYQVSKEQAQANYEQALAAARAQAPQVPVTSNTQGTQATQSELDVLRYQAQIAQNEEQYRSALSQLREAEANQANAAREEERYHALVIKEEVSREQYDQRLTQRDAQTAEVAARREQANAAARVVTQSRVQLEQARSQAKRDRANLPSQVAIQRDTLDQRKAQAAVNKAQADQAELNLQYTQVFAPEDGIIGDKQVQVGTQVSPGQELLALTQTNDIWVTANFKETQVQKMRIGQSVKIHVDALGEDFDGWVENLPGGTGAVYSLLPPENATGNYVKVVQRLPVRIRFKTGQKDLLRLAPGMSVEPKVWLR